MVSYDCDIFISSIAISKDILFFLMVISISLNRLLYSLENTPFLLRETLSSVSFVFWITLMRFVPISLPQICAGIPNLDSSQYNCKSGALTRHNTISPSPISSIGTLYLISPSTASSFASILGAKRFASLTMFFEHLYEIDKGNDIVLGNFFNSTNDCESAP